MELRELVSDIAAQVGERRSDTQALAQTLASQAHKLDEITALQSVALRRLAEVDLDHRSRWPRRIAARLASAAGSVRRALTGRLRGPAGEEPLPLATAPEKPLSVAAFSLIMGRRTLAGSLIGGLAETQEMLDFCAEHGITADVEVIPIQQINEAYERLVKSDVKYRFVIDMASLGHAAK